MQASASTLMGAPLQQRARCQPRSCRAAAVKTAAIFGRKASKAVVEPEAPPAPAKSRGIFSRNTAVVEAPPAPAKSRGIFSRNTAVVEAPPAPAKRGGIFSRNTAVVEAPPAPAKSRGIFSRNKAVVEAPPAPAKSGGLFGGRTKSQESAPAKSPAKAKKQSSKTEPIDKAAEYEKRRSGLSRIIGALDFAEVRSTSDAELLYEARYGKRSKDGKLTEEQAAALRRRVVGTAADYWKDWVDVKGEFVEKGYVAKDQSATASSVPALPFLVLVVVGLFAATAAVVAQTS